MQLKEIKATNNKILNRKELILETEGKIVPDRKKTIEAISLHYNTSKDKISLDRIDASYGNNKIKINAKIYGSAEELNRIENKYLAKRIKGEKDGKEEGKD